MPETDVIITNIQMGPVEGPNASIWSNKPGLSEREDFYDRIVIEVWEKGEAVAYGGIDTLKLAYAALQNIDVKTIETNTPWSNEPVLGRPQDQSFLGRVVLELGAESCVIAVTGTHPIKALIERALVRIQSELNSPIDRTFATVASDSAR